MIKVRKNEINFNNSFKIEEFIQNQTKHLLRSYPPSIQNISKIISGRAGTHPCYRRNYLKLQAYGVQNDRKVADANQTDLLRCTRICQLTSRIRAILLSLLIVMNCLLLVKLKNRLAPNVLVYSTPSEKLSNEQIYNFFVEPRIKQHLQSKKPQILIQKKPNLKNNNQNQKISSTRYIPLYLLRNHLSFRSRIKMLKLVLKNFLELMQVKNCDPLILCQKEFIFEIVLYRSINLNKKTDVIYTQSNLRVLSPISYLNRDNYKIRNIMVWYSTNSDLIYKNHKSSFKIENNYLCLDQIDRHLVWDIAAKVKLSKMTEKDIYVCGSLLFYPYKKSFKQKSNEVFNILFFDITPLEDANMDDFLNPDQAVLSIQEILNVITKIRIDTKSEMILSIKPKREYSKLHSQKYLIYLKQLQEQKKILILKNSSNLYEAVQESDLVICVPWTSPALIAKELGVKTLYYVSDRDYEWDLSQTRNIKLFRDEKKLYSFIRKIVVSKINSGLV